MMTRTFAPWVEPTAALLRANLAQVVTFARVAPTEAWGKASPLDGWTCKDILAHIGKGNDQLFQKLLRTVIAGEAVDTAMFVEVDTDGENKRGVEDRRDQSPEDLIAELEEAGEEIQELLSQLTPEHEQLRQKEPLFHLDGFLLGVGKEGHDLEHLAQLRTALDSSKTQEEQRA